MLRTYTHGVDAARLSRITAGEPHGTDLDLRAVDLGDQDTRNSVVEAVARGASTGSPECLDALLMLIDEQHLDRTSIRRLIVDDTDADDVHQDVLIAVARSITKFRGDSSFNTWLFTVARNTAATHLRRQKDTQALGHDDVAMTDAQRLSSMIATRGLLVAAVEALPDHYRSAVVMRDIEQRTYDDIADTLGLTLNTVKSRLSRGRALVAQRLRDGDFDGAGFFDASGSPASGRESQGG